ncbi:transcriptional regulator [Serinibacter arcticus]|uniref:Transcriptional regulator n=1 Tax=Serinibacter arcticus TaxID=1655435 RepID=A0A2U1ZUX0_9MICO|nr:GAF and ANTAR domain-containing protein [Serinibacter arcticus]PWD50774.1 transcriptional regulator [Serinibacter arcticus]
MALSSSSPLCDRYLEIGGVEEVVVLVNGPGLPSEIAAAAGDSRFASLEIDLGEGPSWTAVHSRQVVSVLDRTAADERWPVLAHALAELDLGADPLVASPLAIAGLTVGAVEVVGRPGRPLSDESRRAVEALARPTALLLMASTLHDSTLEASENPHSRRVVHQATGMVLHALRLSPEDALTVLRARAFTQGRPLVEVATDVVERRSDLLPSPPPTLEHS